jgi:hypothetical protein
MNIRRRFWRHVDTAGECWLWTGELSHNGYGRFAVEHKKRRKNRVPAHRFALGLAGINVPDDMEVDHLCKTRNCVRVSHLDVVTSRENNRRSNSVAGINSRKTECIRGHKLAGDNLYITPNGRRQCSCRNMSSKALYDRRTVAA